MPGITGIICKKPCESTGRDLELMIDAMRHETFYQGGQYVNKELGLYAGWMCHAGSFADCMPLISRTKDAVLIFEGEHFQDSGLSAKEDSGGKIHHHTARDVMRLYEEVGEAFLRELNGWFCGVLIDLKKRTVTLFNDRYGMSRIYFCEADDEFLFASEAKSLLKVRSRLRTLDPEGVAHYLRFNCVTANKTLFRGISLLPNGSFWVFDHSGRAKKSRYFNPTEWEQQLPLQPGEFYEQFSATVKRAFPRYVQGAEKVSLALTAGLDSRLILAAVPSYNGSLSCCTYGGTWGETFDIGTAREIARLQNHPFDVIRINESFLKSFESFAQRSVYLSDGTHDAFGAHDVYLNQIARQIAPVRLTGKFGSEVVKNRTLITWSDYSSDFLQPDFTPWLERLKPRNEFIQKNSLSQAVFEEIPWYEFGRVAVEQSQLTLRSPYLDNDLVKLMFQALPSIRSGGQAQGNYLRKNNPQLAAIQTNMGDMGTNNQLLINIRNAFYQILFKTEFIYLFSAPHWLTWIDRRLEALRLERLFAGREKFEGYRIWIRTDFADFIRETLLRPEVEYARFFNKASVERMVTRHIAGTHNYLSEINKVLTVELICSSLLRA